VPDKFGGIMSGHFSHKTVAVVFDCPFAAGEVSGYLLIGSPRDYQPKYLALTSGQSKIPVFNIENEGVF
jgi:hypothetical protein